MKLVGKKIGDPRIMELLRKFLSAGHIDPKSKRLIKESTGTPQAQGRGILSPLLSNIVLHELDSYMEKYAESFKLGSKRRLNPEYKKLAVRRGKSTCPEERATLLKEMRKMRRSDMFDPSFRRLKYVRYADDFIILVTGSLKDANFIKNNVKDILKTKCGLELNYEKTSIENIAKDNWKFLGAEIKHIRHNPE